MIQVRNVPERLHRELKRRAKLNGQTLTDYVQGVLEREVRKPDRREVLARILEGEKIELGCMTGADLVHEARREAGRE